MRRTRNPRYAPESLERKLSPSYFGLTPPTQVHAAAPTAAASYAGDPQPAYPRPYDPPLPSGPFPPVTLPGYPGGPGEPALI
jgi:hypothetical protein